MRAWRDCYGRLPTSYDWSRTHARRSGDQALERLDGCDWPSASVVCDVFGTWEAARAAREPAGKMITAARYPTPAGACGCAERIAGAVSVLRSNVLFRL